MSLTAFTNNNTLHFILHWSLGLIPDGKRGPPVPFFDFLAIMDQEAPTYAAQRGPKMKNGGREGNREQKHETPDQKQTPYPSPNPQAPRQHSEL